MTPALPPSTARSASAAPAPAVPALSLRRRVGPQLLALTVVLALVAALLAGALAIVLAPVSGTRAGPLAVALAAAMGVLVAAVPMVWLVFKLAAELRPAARRADAGFATSAGMPQALFMNLVEREFARARRYGTGAALVLVEVDRHDRLCEARGQAAGNAVLAEMLHLTAPTLRTADVLTHFGGAQMAVFLVHADATGALDVAERIRERSEQMEVPFPATPPGLRLRVTVSTGVAHLRPAHLNLQALIDDAQDAVTAARAAGGNCVRAAPVDLGRPVGPGNWRERRLQPRPAPPRQGGA